MTDSAHQTPAQRYQADLDQGLIQVDPVQSQIVEQLDDLYHQLLSVDWRPDKTRFSLWSWLRLANQPQVRPKGIYLWGGVGRGKTYLMDLFYDCLPLRQKRRTHFHRFMQSVHRQLATHSGEKDPLALVAQDIAQQARILCFDEFFVSDIGDAMILAGILKALFEQDVVLIATSNIEPDQLYKNGLQRDSFVPAINLIKQRCRVVEITKGQDYRLRCLEQATLYHYPLDQEVEQKLLAGFRRLAPDLGEAVEDGQIDILGRLINTRCSAHDVVWFDFDQLCSGPRSAADYVEIAKIYHAVLIGKVPALDTVGSDVLRRFITLVDELYDRNVKLVLAAAVPLEQLYQGSVLAFEFERTRSRLLEMQSHDYLAREHRP